MAECGSGWRPVWPQALLDLQVAFPRCCPTAFSAFPRSTDKQSQTGVPPAEAAPDYP